MQENLISSMRMVICNKHLLVSYNQSKYTIMITKQVKTRCFQTATFTVLNRVDLVKFCIQLFEIC